MSVASEKMPKTRRALGSLSGVVNVGGEEALRRRAGPEESPAQRHTRRMYARQEEAWRPLNKQRVASFIQLFILCFVEVENGLPLQPITYKLLKKTLVKRVVPWIYRRLAFTMDEAYWPISMEQFKQVDQYLATHFPTTQRDHPWETVSYFFKEVLKRREELQRLEDMEKEVMEAVRRCLEQ